MSHRITKAALKEALCDMVDQMSADQLRQIAQNITKNFAPFHMGEKPVKKAGAKPKPKRITKPKT